MKDRILVEALGARDLTIINLQVENEQLRQEIARLQNQIPKDNPTVPSNVIDEAVQVAVKASRARRDKAAKN